MSWTDDLRGDDVCVLHWDILFKQRHVWKSAEVTYLGHFMLSLSYQKAWVNSHKACNFIEQHETSSDFFFSCLLPDPSISFKILNKKGDCYLLFRKHF